MCALSGAEPELEGLSDESPPNEGDTSEAWGKRSDVVSDVGSAFDGLNLTTAVPSQVWILHNSDVHHSHLWKRRHRSEARLLLLMVSLAGSPTLHPN